MICAIRIYLLIDVDGQVYLLYVAAGEQSIGVVGLDKAAP